MKMLARLLCLGLSWMPALAAATDSKEWPAFGGVTYREATHEQDPQKRVIGMPARSARLTVTAANMSFIDDGTSLSISFQTQGCASSMSLDGYDEISLPKGLRQTIVGPASELAKGCGLHPASIAHWRQHTLAQSTEILAAVDYMKHRSIMLIGPLREAVAQGADDAARHVAGRFAIETFMQRVLTPKLACTSRVVAKWVPFATSDIGREADGRQSTTCRHSRCVHSSCVRKIRRRPNFVGGDKMMAGRSVCMLLIVAALSVSGDALASASAREVNQNRQVKGDDIAVLLKGKLITPSMRDQQSAPPAGEWFGIDHQWHASLQSAALQQIAGTWEVESNSICVMRTDKPKFCRAVWRNSKSGEISIPMVPDWSTTTKPIIIDVFERSWGPEK